MEYEYSERRGRSRMNGALNWRNIPNRYYTENNATGQKTYDTPYGRLKVRSVCPKKEVRPVYIRAEFSPDNLVSRVKRLFGIDTEQVAEKHDEDISFDIYTDDTSAELKTLFEVENETMRPKRPSNGFHKAVVNAISQVKHQ